MKQKIINLLENELKSKLSKKEIEKLIEIPPSEDLGDFSFPCFSLASVFKENPSKIASDLSQKLNKKNKDFEKIIPAGQYINFYLNKKQLIKNILKNSEKTKQKTGKTIMVEFSQANTHKAFHVGHIRGTSLGESIARILEYQGNKVIRANYQGDTGMHIAKWLWCYNKYHKNEKIKPDESWIASIYVDAIKRLTSQPELQEEVNKINQELEQKQNKELLKQWEKTRKISLEAFEKIYEDLDTKFDVYYFESQVEEKAKKISLELLRKNIAKKSQGAIIIDLENFGLSVWVLLRQDGTVLYSAKDLALVKEKFKKNIDKSIYIVASAQSLHFQQLFKTLELMGFKHKEKSEHVSYDLVRLPHGKMSSRTGDNILYQEFKQEIFNYAKQETKKRFPKLDKKQLETRALAISISAIKYSMLKQSSEKPIIFNKKQALNFEGDSGPYIQYSYARASSILRKIKNKKQKLEIKNLHESEIKLAKKINNFSNIIEKAAENLSPSLIANYSFELAKLFNEFYHNCPVINSKEKEQRIALVKLFKKTISNCLNLLGIKAIEKM